MAELTVRDEKVVIPGSIEWTLPETLPRKGDPIIMSWVPEDQIPEAHRAYVRRHVDRAARRLGLGPIAIRWFGSGSIWIESHSGGKHAHDGPGGAR